MTDEAKKLYDMATGTQAPVGPVLHVRVQGRSRDIALDAINVTAASSDDAIREAVATFMDIGSAQLRNTVIERHDNGNLTLRPEAVFG